MKKTKQSLKIFMDRATGKSRVFVNDKELGPETYQIKNGILKLK